MLQTQPLEISDFSGGITDNYIDCAPNKFLYGDNLLITRNKKLVTRLGSRFYDSDNPQLPIGTFRANALINFENTLLAQSNNYMYYSDAGYNEFEGPTGNNIFDVNGDFDYISYSPWNSQLFITNDSYAKPVKVYKDGSNVWQTITAGLPALASSPMLAGTAGANNYIYAFIYSYDYTVGTVQFQDVSEPIFVEINNVNAPDVNTINITSIPTLSNGSTNNYDVDNIKVKIYRTENNGATFYFVDEVDNGTSSYADNTADSVIVDNEPIYTDGGLLPYTEPPQAKYVHIVSDVGYYANIQEGSEILKDRVLLSIPGNPSAVPRLFFIDLGEEIVGLSSVDDVPLVFCKNSIYRIDGTFDALGRGSVSQQRIASTVGGVSNRAIVKIPGGCFFAGTDGFYFTDGYKVIKISREFNKRYKGLVENETQASRICGAYDPTENRVWFGVSTNAGINEDNDVCYILDLNFGLKEEMPFTTASNGVSFAPTALVFFEKNLIRGDKRGYIFIHTDGELSDPKVETDISEDSWTKETIIHLYEGFATSFNTNMVRKWVTRMSLMAKNESSVSIQVVSINDDYKKEANLSLIKFNGQLVWGDAELVWGDPELVWNEQGLISEKRHFPKTNLRCNLKQIRITNGFSSIRNSDISGLASVNAGAKQAVLTNINSSWPLYARDYYITFEDDNYTKLYKIILRPDDLTITLDDPEATLPSGDQAWVIKGFAKNEVLHLLSYTLHYAPLGMTQGNFEPSAQGNNE